MNRHIAAAVVLLLAGCQNARADDVIAHIEPGFVSATDLTRGANITFNSDTYPYLDEHAFAVWGGWGIRVLRFTFDKDDFADVYSDAPAGEVFRPYQQNLVELEKNLLRMRRENMTAIVCLDHVWGDDHLSMNLWANRGENEYLEHRVKLCEAVARWVKDRDLSDVVKTLEVWNEPYPCEREIYANVFLPKAISAIRGVNPDITIGVMPPFDWGLPWGFSGWSGVAYGNVVYSTHIYAPQTYTHQGVSAGYPLLATGWPGFFKNYPSDAQAEYMNRDSAIPLMTLLKEFEGRSGGDVIVTEFGVARWARNAGFWMRDLISMMEEYEIGWLFHSIAGWNGWNPSFHAGDPEGKQPFGSGTPSLELLKFYWSGANPRPSPPVIGVTPVIGVRS